MRYGFGIQLMTEFTPITETYGEASTIYPNLSKILSKIRLAPFWKNDGLMQPIWRYHRGTYCLFCTISINIRVFLSKEYDASNLRGILWHELGHVFAWLVCLKDSRRFHINKNGRLEYSPDTNELDAENYTKTIRASLLDDFWNRETNKYGKYRVAMLEQILNPHPFNSSELIAESFKYAFAGEGYICEDQFVLVKNIVNDFISEYVQP